jgi:hypothetical protein
VIDLMPNDGTVGYEIPKEPDGLFRVKEWDTDGRLIRVQERRLREGMRDPFSSEFDHLGEVEQERLFWERTVKVSDTLQRSGRTPQWVKVAFVVSMILNPATWIAVGWKLWREGVPRPPAK